MKYIYSTIVIIAIIAIAWFVFDHKSPYPMSPEEIEQSMASSTAPMNTASSTVSATVSDSSVNKNQIAAAQGIKTNKNFMHKITIETNKGTIVFETYDVDAPNTVANFIKLANQGFYNGIIFHRVIDGFMIQGGDPTGTGMGGPGYKFADELDPNTPSAKAGYVRGTVAMANSGPNTNGSQFFIMQKDTPLPHSYTIFGKVISGMDVVDAIASTKTDSNDKPIDKVVMNKVTVEEVK